MRLARIDETMYWCGTSGRALGTKRPKNTQERMLVIPVNLVMDLLEFEEDKSKRRGLLFHHNGKPLQMRSVLKSYQIGLRRAGIKHLSGTHLLRRTAATLANAMTGDVYAVSSLLGHSDPKVTLKYVTPTIRHKERVAGTGLRAFI